MKEKIRKAILITLLLLLASTLTAKGENEKKTLVISTWGYNEDQLLNTIFDPFAEENGIMIELDTGGTADRYNRLLNDKNTDIDVFFTAQSYAQKAIDAGLFEQFDADKLSHYNRLYPQAQQPNGAGYGVAYTVNRLRIAIQEKTLPAGIQASDIRSWEDLYRSELQEQLTVPSITSTFGPAMIYIGAQHEKSRPHSDRGMKGLQGIEALLPNILKSYTRSSAAKTMLQNEEISVALVADYAYSDLTKAIPDLIFIDPSEGSYVNFNTVNIVKGSVNQELAYQFIDHLIAVETQQNVADIKLDSPVNQDVVLSASAAKGLSDLASIKNVEPLDALLINENLETWTNQWNAIFVSKE